ncbi:hypothetical protein B9Z55_001830 [Caenorhabditis nigoni]|uniref:Uncharacterized protein n=1 Tax=Caenorhabditis nigoni TaxID=1611254 RepID=A0A2G5VHG5_9PELO|nr:hypothetical protein B9Z55_001830 [Caenorhabditis nigoni]
MYAQGHTPTVVHASPYGAPVYGQPAYAQPCVQQPGGTVVVQNGGGNRAEFVFIRVTLISPYFSAIAVRVHAVWLFSVAACVE